MLIKQLTTYAGPDGLREVGVVWDAPAEQAQALIAGNYAAQVEVVAEAAEEVAAEAENTAKTHPEAETPEGPAGKFFRGKKGK